MSLQYRITYLALDQVDSIFFLIAAAIQAMLPGKVTHNGICLRQLNISINVIRQVWKIEPKRIFDIKPAKIEKVVYLKLCKPYSCYLQNWICCLNKLNQVFFSQTFV